MAIRAPSELIRKQTNIEYYRDTLEEECEGIDIRTLPLFVPSVVHQ